ncbi:GNAT family N-acetyltransferase [Paracrocinitomix mangrovi]|uniref:GNAT family N-acetyltransferase n=1 Tax=Paracrocinitomix mangrovi TaxID=2862509 RepID=UPI001C8D365C|nr:GNAT family N-acetyltransferase [Paracrocinitomix mangrovi]UKN02815.1 GNAT family N-acetyltransferase [Paracrocinitomix mangrovi]
MAINIIKYEDWMLDQVTKMFCEQYDFKAEEFQLYFKNFYETPYQQDKCVRYAAVEGDKLAGFQSFFYWPYKLNEQVFNSFQSGNSLVNPEFRGQGIFGKLLNAIHEDEFRQGIDFLMGFPVQASYNSFLRAGWNNVLDLQWYVKPLGPVSIIRSIKEVKLGQFFRTEPLMIKESIQEQFRFNKTTEFIKWRNKLSENTYYYFVFEDENEVCQFEVKINVRKKVINELIIGDIQSSYSSLEFLNLAFQALIKACKSLKFISIITIAVNNAASDELLDILREKKFKPLNKSVHFITHPVNWKGQLDLDESWRLFRSDIDTW